MIVIATLEFITVLLFDPAKFAYYVPSLVSIIAGIVSVVSESPTVRVVVFWVMAIAAGVGFILFLCFNFVFTLFAGSNPELMLPYWLVFALVFCPLIYFRLRIAYHYIEEAKDNED